LGCELAKTKERVSRMKVEQSLFSYSIAELEKQMKTSKEASIEIEFESTNSISSSRFQLKAIHPDAAKALKEFAAQIIDGQRDGTIWLPGPVANA
jgi:hypothetical protein